MLNNAQKVMFENLSNAPRKTRSIKISFWLLLGGIVVFGWYVDTVNYNRLVQEEKSRAYETVNVYRTQIEGILATNIQLLRGLAVAIAQDKKLTQNSFERIAEPLFQSSGVLRNIGAAPDMVLQYIYPLSGNEQALGLNYLTHPTQSTEAIQAKDSGEIVLAGPLDLLQGGQALIARVPVLDRNNNFWGLLSVVIDTEKLFSMARMEDLKNHYYVAIQGKDGLGKQGEFFYGDSNILLEQPLSLSISVASGKWQLYVYPTEGWQPQSATIWPFRLALITIILLFIGAFVFFNRLLKQLQDNAHSLSSMGALAEVGAWTINLKSRNISWSEVTKQIFEVPNHYQPSWIATTEFFVAGHHRRLIQETFDNAIKQGIDFEQEMLIKTETGKERWLLVKGRAIRHGKYTSQLYGSVQNIHTRKCLEIERNKVAKNNELLARLSSHEAVLNLNLDPAQNVAIQVICEGLKAQRASIWLLNSDGSQLIPTGFSNTRDENLQHFPPWRKKQLPELFSAVYKQELISANFAHTHPCTQELKDNYLSPYEVNAILGCSISYKGHAIGLLCAEYQHPHLEWDITDEKLIKAVAATLGSLFASQEQQQARQQAVMEKELAQQSAKIKAEFLASMSHEIRTPLNGVLGMLEIVTNSNLSPSQKHHLQLAQNSADSLLTIINDILDFSKIEAGKLHVETIDCDLVQVISDSISNFAPRALEQHTRLILDTHKLQVQWAKTDPNRLKQVLNNLLSNAIKFTKHGTVTLTCYTEQQAKHTRLWCNIEDTGVGISKSQLGKIFDSFTQADPSTTRKFGGTGLGLTIARQLCELLGGSLNAYSKIDVGSTFSFYIELHEPQSIQPIECNCGALMIIDTMLNKEAQQHNLFDAWGINVVHTDSIVKALEYIESHQVTNPDFIISCAQISDATPQALKRLQALIEQSTSSLAVLGNELTSNQEYPPLKPDLSLLRPLTPADMLKLCQIELPDSKQNETTLDISHLNVLLVEDNKINQTVALKLLSRFGITAISKDDGQQAAEHLKSTATAYDIILMDCLMPELDGYQTTNLIRSGGVGKQHKHTPIIALTANAMQGDKQKCLAAGMDDYISKPVKVDELEAKLRQWNNETKQSVANSVQ
ncbi:Sensor histidine kinase RcsC [Pseudoalteromonas holothuriae]|uniref:histidine kinase n=1 Tax=Pseudoalteromonas holothuriae TaxID=2963714 RepID=A0ABM9GML8_9GAMM|nr:ATP-binding protein [Pseudoalteromonas sp. CIP111951]CAH9067151.1 Sensor histidine kinase RcsC [Pseudoalteromonas sp. CIP111951]